MKARWNLDVVRGLMLAYAMLGIYWAIGVLRVGFAPFQPHPARQLWRGLEDVVIFIFIFLALLFPSRGRLKAVFVLLAVVAIILPLHAFWQMRNFQNLSLPMPLSHFLYWQMAWFIVAAVAAWFLYRAEPKR